RPRKLRPRGASLRSPCTFRCPGSAANGIRGRRERMDLSTCRASASTDELDDLDHVPLADRARRVLGSGNDVAVQLDRDPPTAETELGQQIGDRLSVLERALLAIHDRNHEPHSVTRFCFLYNGGSVP